jgi:hypothetical protein
MAGKRASGKAKSRKVFGHPSKQVNAELRAGLYARVSTHDQQTIPLQTRALRDYVARRGWTIAVQVKEVGSGASQRELREKLLGGGAPPRDRRGVSVAAGSLGPVGHRPAGDPPGSWSIWESGSFH